MTSGQKVAISLLTAILVFAAFAVLSFTKLFSVVETRFYQNAIVRDVNGKLADVSTFLEQYINDTQKSFAPLTENHSIKSSFAFDQSNENIKGREDAFGALMNAVPALRGVRIIDKNGKRIHYSTFAHDILQQTDKAISYRLYDDLNELAYSEINTSDVQEARIVCDPKNERILYCFPLHDTFFAYRGTLVFYTASSDFIRKAVHRKLVRFTDKAVFAGSREKPVFVFGLPNTVSENLIDTVNKKWEQGISAVEKIAENEKSDVWVLLSDSGNSFASVANVRIYAAWLYPETLFIFSNSLKVLLLLSVFVSTLLVIFLVFNIKSDDMNIIRERIKRFQLAVINEYAAAKTEVDWNMVYADMSRRKQEVREGIKRSLGSRAKRRSGEVDFLLDTSWNEIMAVLSAQSGIQNTGSSDVTADQIKDLLEQILLQGGVHSTRQSEVQTPVHTMPESETAYTAIQTSSENSAQRTEVQTLEQALPEGETALQVEDIDELEELGELDEVEDLEDLTEYAEQSESETQSAEVEPATIPQDVEPETSDEQDLVDIDTDTAEPEITDEQAFVDTDVVEPEADSEQDLVDIETCTETDTAEPDEAESAALADEVVPADTAESADAESELSEITVMPDTDESESKAEVAPEPELEVEAEVSVTAAAGSPDYSDEPAESSEDVQASAKIKSVETYSKPIPVSVFQKNIVLDTIDSETKHAADSILSKADEVSGDVSAAEFLEELPFSFTLGKMAPPPSGLLLKPASEPILEKDGLFVIADEAELDTPGDLNSEFKELVDSVLKI